jgi:transcriptional regulator with XRE-family HTH domain
MGSVTGPMTGSSTLTIGVMRHTADPSTTPLKAWRLNNDLTIEEVAGVTGLSTAMCSLVERNKRRLAPLTKILFARRLGVPVAELFPPEPVDVEAAQ